MKGLNQLYEELTKITMVHGTTDMNKLMYETFKKRRVDLLDTNQIQTLLDLLIAFYAKDKK